MSATDQSSATAHPMTGKTVVITGANSGIGKQTALELGQRGAHVVMAGRDSEKSRRARDELAVEAPAGRFELRALDLASFADVRRFATDALEELEHIGVLLNNAGTVPTRLQLTEDGFEAQIGVNHLGHYLLTRLLLPKLQEGDGGRIVHVSSILHAKGEIDFDNFRGEKGYKPLPAYYQSKLANVLFSNELARRLEGTSVTSNALHPGGIRTGIMRHSNLLIRAVTHVKFKPVTEGAHTSVMLASDPALAGVSGRYYDQGVERPCASRARDTALAAQLWKHSAELCGLD
jgi:NAD(P)-dependent dehydrogenase (short-subunit alcohol dehydrogenase family)